MGWEEWHKCNYYPFCQIHMGLRRPRVHLTVEEVLWIKEKYAAGISVQEMADALGLPYRRPVQDVIRGVRHQTLKRGQAT